MPPQHHSSQGATTFPFLKLPQELRDHVYRELLIPEKVGTADLPFEPEYTLEISILHTNK